METFNIVSVTIITVTIVIIIIIVTIVIIATIVTIVIIVNNVIKLITYQEAKKMTLTATMRMFVRLLRACFRVNLCLNTWINFSTWVNLSTWYHQVSPYFLVTVSYMDQMWRLGQPGYQFLELSYLQTSSGCIIQNDVPRE